LLANEENTNKFMNYKMTNINQEETLSLIESVIKQSQAEGVFVSVSQSESALSRFSENQISQNISKNKFNLSITSYFGQRSATASTTELEPESVEETIKRSEELASYAPEDPEWVALLEPQTYQQRIPAFDRETANLSPLARGKMIQKVCSLSERAGMEGSGTLSVSAYRQAVGNSLGLIAYSEGTEADFSFTARKEGGSAWSNRTAWSIDQIPLEEMTEEVIQKAIASCNPQTVAPGVYPVVISSAAMSSLLPWMVWNLDARAADEGRSFMSLLDENGKPGGNRVGEQLFDPLVQVQRNPAHPLLQSSPFFSDGLSNEPLELVKDGIVEQLNYSRYWAQKQGKQPTGAFYPIVMTGSDRALADLISETERGVLISRAWYVRYVNPRTLEITGMTRDGTFWIEGGKIAYPIKNLRFNQNLPQMLMEVEAIGKVDRFGATVVPSVKVKAFNFSSITDSV
jgi:predicted Zn-dependent protease